jgi:hypothetical protein
VIHYLIYTANLEIYNYQTGIATSFNKTGRSDFVERGMNLPGQHHPEKGQ